MVIDSNEFIEKIGAYLRVEQRKELDVNVSPVPGSKGIGTRAISLAKQCKEPHFGKTREDETLVRQWIEYAVCYGCYVDVAQTARQVLKELNGVLATRAYLVGNALTLADVGLYYMLYSVVLNLSYQEKEQYLHLSRWFNNLQQDSRLRQNNKLINFSRTPLYI
ncbi:hypothetical protein L9F63_024117 [Diploptera punctata]|uniref:GST C-terminal domain-containing protein n=1 Tax=Diploptera punctata TaxID=6984 RepID=A0AAD8E8M5_DIPPU|nr:hypothetical protein L9F63_024117 [Diploptera punctata]